MLNNVGSFYDKIKTWVNISHKRPRVSRKEQFLGLVRLRKLTPEGCHA